jgi:serine-type D-Ala-D-Ala carboxypeptidase (penicillin-binding protein 5/6)
MNLRRTSPGGLIAAIAAAAVIAAGPVALSQGAPGEKSQGQKPAPAKGAEAGGKPAKPGGAAPTPAPAPPATAPDGSPLLAARAWLLVDPRDGTVLASKSADIPRPIASATKLMTAYVALRKLRPGKVLTAPSYNALAAESLLGLQAGERITVRDLLYGLILESGNDAAVTLATGAAGSVGAFVAQMNRQAETLGLSNTSYANPVGLDSPRNYSTATDLVELATVLLDNRLFAKVADSETATLTSGNLPRQLSTRNTLLTSDPTLDGVKTGHTIGAGYVLVGSATRDGTQLVSAVLGARSEAARDAETERLLDYGFSLYQASRPVAAGAEFADPELDYRDETVSLVAKRGIEVSAREGQSVETEVDAPDEVSGAVEEGEQLGTVVVRVDGRAAGRSPLVAASSVEAASITDKALSVLSNPLVLIPLGLILLGLGLWLLSRRRRRGEGGGVFPAAGPNGSGPGAQAVPPPTQSEPGRRKREKASKERTPEERRQMHEERMRRRRERAGQSEGER